VNDIEAISVQAPATSTTQSVETKVDVTNLSTFEKRMYDALMKERRHNSIEKKRQEDLPTNLDVNAAHTNDLEAKRQQSTFMHSPAASAEKVAQQLGNAPGNKSVTETVTSSFVENSSASKLKIPAKAIEGKMVTKDNSYAEQQLESELTSMLEAEKRMNNTLMEKIDRKSQKPSEIGDDTNVDGPNMGSHGISHAETDSSQSKPAKSKSSVARAPSSDLEKNNFDVLDKKVTGRAGFKLNSDKSPTVLAIETSSSNLQHNEAAGKEQSSRQLLLEKSSVELELIPRISSTESVLDVSTPSGARSSQNSKTSVETVLNPEEQRRASIEQSLDFANSMRRSTPSFGGGRSTRSSSSSGNHSSPHVSAPAPAPPLCPEAKK
jgi:hypothetical protein